MYLTYVPFDLLADAFGVGLAIKIDTTFLARRSRARGAIAVPECSSRPAATSCVPRRCGHPVPEGVGHNERRSA